MNTKSFNFYLFRHRSLECESTEDTASLPAQPVISEKAEPETKKDQENKPEKDDTEEPNCKKLKLDE